MQLFTDPGTTMTHHYNLDPIIDTLKKGGTILYPTDTTWSIGCDATDETAVERIFELKNRDRSRPFTLLVSSIEMLKNYVAFLHPRIETLLVYHERPLTIIYEKSINLPTNVTGPGNSVGIRIPKDDFCRQLIERYGKPIVSTGANISNKPFPSHFGEISSAVIIGVDYVVKYRQLDKEMGVPSVVARLGENGELEFLRE